MALWLASLDVDKGTWEEEGIFGVGGLRLSALGEIEEIAGGGGGLLPSGLLDIKKDRGMAKLETVGSFRGGNSDFLSLTTAISSEGVTKAVVVAAATAAVVSVFVTTTTTDGWSTSTKSFECVEREEDALLTPSRLFSRRTF